MSVLADPIHDGHVAATLGAIDCDVHPALPGISVLLPYLEPYWRDYVVVRGVGALELTSAAANAPASSRPDWRINGALPGTSLPRMRSDLLDRFGLRAAICNVVWGGQGLFNEHLAAALCRATNDWLAAEWLARDDRLRASIIVPWQHPPLAAAEIDRLAGDKRFVQVLLLAMGDMPLGRPHYWPIYEAAARHGLPVGIHAGGALRHATTSLGWPSYQLEDYVAQAPAFQMQLMSLVSEGVFARVPELRVVLIESGFTWLPAHLWRATKIWRAMRMEVPWVQRSPTEIIRDHVRFTLQPFDAPPDAALVERVMNQVGSDRMLLFSTDYPHWHFNDDDAVPDGLSPDLLKRVLVDNPLDTYPRLQGATS